MKITSDQLPVVSERIGEKRMAKFILFWLPAAFLVTTVSFAAAEQPRKVYRIGYLASVRGGITSTEHAVRGGLRDLGYIEGENIIIEARSAEGKVDRLPGLVAELIDLKVDVIVVSSIQGALAAKKATQSIPIVFAVAQDPVGSGIVASLAQPGGNLTGGLTLRGS